MVDKETSLKLAFLSFVSVVLVVCIHVPVTHDAGFSMFFETLFGSKIPSVAVPFFFAASGYLLASRMGVRGEGYYVQLKKRVWSLLIPYLFWCLALGLQVNLNSLLANIANNYPLMRHIDLNPIHIFGLDIRRNPPLPLWFLRALMLYVIASPVLLFVARRKFAMIALIAALITFDCTDKLYVHKSLSAMFCFTLAPKNIFAFVCGMWFCGHPIKLSPRQGWFSLVAGMVIFVILSLFVSWQVKLHCSLAGLLPKAAIVLFIAGSWTLCPAVELPELIRGQSFPIYLLHAVFVPYAHLIAQNVKFMFAWPGFIVNVCALVGGSLLMSWTLRKYLPRFSKVIFGGR